LWIAQFGDSLVNRILRIVNRFFDNRAMPNTTVAVGFIALGPPAGGGVGPARRGIKSGGVRSTPPVPYGHRRGARSRSRILRDGTRNLNLTFALSTNAKNFSTGFPRSSLASADRDAESDVVETYPLELPTAKLR